MPRLRLFRSGDALLLGLTLALAPAPLPAQETPGFLTPTLSQANAAEGPKPLLPGQSGVVVLTDGRVFAGQITETGGGYRVDFDAKFVVIPFEQVKVTAVTVRDAYILIRDTLKSPLAVDHLKLAEWCQQNNLLEEAKIEAATALKLEPLRSDARGLLWQIDQKMAAQAKLAPPSEVVQAIPMVGTVGAPGATVTVGGLSRESHQAFIRQVQPLLFNKCGNSGCHGGEVDNSFVLTGNRSSSTNDRLGSEANLESVLRQINAEDAAASPLIAKPSELLGNHRRVFQGASGGTQRQLLVNWATQVVAEQTQSTLKRPPTRLPTALPANPLQQTAEVSPASPATEPRRLPASTPGSQLAGAGPAGAAAEGTLDNAALRAILNEQKPDAFDPEAFNRLVHGASAAEMKAASSASAGTR